MRAKIYVSQIAEPYTKQNFKIIGSLFNEIPFLKGQWRFIEFTLSASGTDIQLAHGLGFAPKDIILLSAVAGTVTFNYDLMDSNYFYVTATLAGSAPMTVRAFIGRYTEDAVNV